MSKIGRRIALCVALFAVVPSRSFAQSCGHPSSCNVTVNGTLDFSSGACLDSETRRYDYYTFDTIANTVVTATVQSAFFAPAIQLISPANVVMAIDENGGSSQSATVTLTLPSSGTWTVRVRNKDVGTGGPYTLTLRCGSGGGGGGGGAVKAFLLSSTPTLMTLQHGQSATLHVTSTPINGFAAGVRLSISNLPTDVTAEPSEFSFPSPGVGSFDTSIRVGDVAPGGRFNIVTTGIGTDGTTAVTSSNLVVDAICLSPFVQVQPHNAVVVKGASTTLSVAAGGTPPFAYQWYQGHTGSALFPIAGATAADMVTPVVTSDAEFWVRIFNACGSRDSDTAVVRATAAPRKRRSVRHH